MSAGSYQRTASSNNSSSTSGGGGDCGTLPAAPSAAGSVRLAGDNTKDRMYEPKHHQKAVRVLTVVAYIFFVSLAAITLSLYYLFIYNPPPQPPHPANQMYGAAPNPNAYVINITDCKKAVAVTVVNRTQPTPVLETPRVLSVRDRRPVSSPRPLTDNGTSTEDAGDRSNSTRYTYGSEYGKAADNDMDYYT